MTKSGTGPNLGARFVIISGGRGPSMSGGRSLGLDIGQDQQARRLKVFIPAAEPGVQAVFKDGLNAAHFANYCS